VWPTWSRIADTGCYLVNNAGCNLPGSTLETPIENIHKQFSANVFAAIYLVRAVVPHMPTGGRIINISSVASKLGMETIPFYSAAKAASDSLTYVWATEVSHGLTDTLNTLKTHERTFGVDLPVADWGRTQFGRTHGITVNTVSPGPVVTDEYKKFVKDNAEGFKSIRRLIDQTRAAERIGEIDDIADAVLLLVQEKSRWITGQYISVSGGITGN
jgi:NAD(P)-dependent dehydrogenase (short-subunit alcohol dehydrogenase family)